jgi:signal transduction histidine kinase
MSGRWLFLLVWMALAALTALVCWLLVPDYRLISAYRIDDPGKPVELTVAMLPAAMDADWMIYVPSHGGKIDVTLGEGRRLGSVADQPAAQLARNRLLGTMTLPTSLATGRTQLVKLTHRDDPHQMPAAPIFLGPKSLLGPVAAEHLSHGRIMQWTIPAAAILTILISTLLIFFSRRPLKYILLIAAISLQLMVELADWLGGFGLPLERWVPHAGAVVNVLIAMAIAAWTYADRRDWRLVLALGVIMPLVFGLGLLVDLDRVPAAQVPLGIFYAIWLLTLQLNSWRMILRSKRTTSLGRSGALATFLLGGTGLLAYALLNSTRPEIATAFFLANWVNTASAIAVTAFILGALFTEVSAYRLQRLEIGTLEAIVAGHYDQLDEQALALQQQIERAAVLEERQRFLADMHDGIGGQMLTLLLKLRRVDGPAAQLADDVQAMIGDLRLMASTIGAEEVGAGIAFTQLRERIAAQTAAAGVVLDWQVVLPVGLELSPPKTLELLRIVEEAVTNAVKHADAATIAIKVASEGGLILEIGDDGCGFDPATVRQGTGLRSLRYRVQKLGGHFAFTRGADGKGTVLTVTLPPPSVNQTGSTSRAAGLREPLQSSI